MGAAERAVLEVQRQCRTLRFDLERRQAPLALSPDMAIWPRLVRHITWLFNRPSRRPTAGPPYEDAVGTGYAGDLAMFG